MMALGIPIYVCASASVPIAAGLIHLGASPGAVLAFLIAGPASNAATITTIWKLLGRRTVFLYLLTIAISAVGAGLLLDWLLPAMQITVPDVPEKCHDAVSGGWVSGFWAILLLAVLAFSYAATCFPKRKRAEQTGEGGKGERLQLAIDGMTCGHCVAAVTRALKSCRGVASVQVDLAGGRAVVAGEGLKRHELIAAVESVGYETRVVDEPSSRYDQ